MSQMSPNEHIDKWVRDAKWWWLVVLLYSKFVTWLISSWWRLAIVVCTVAAACLLPVGRYDGHRGYEKLWYDFETVNTAKADTDGDGITYLYEMQAYRDAWIKSYGYTHSGQFSFRDELWDVDGRMMSAAEVAARHPEAFK